MISDNKRKILLIDDSSVNNLLLQTILEEVGHEVVITYNGNDALKIMETDSIDLVLLDIMMPQFDGFKVLAEIKQNKKINNIPIVMVTAKKEQSSKDKAMELGAADYIIKPIDIKDTVLRINRILED